MALLARVARKPALSVSRPQVTDTKEEPPEISFPPRAFHLAGVDLAAQAVEQYLSCRPPGFSGHHAPEELSTNWWTVLESEPGAGRVIARLDFEYDRMPARVSKGAASLHLVVQLVATHADKVSLRCDFELKGWTPTYPEIARQASRVARHTLDTLSTVIYEVARYASAPSTTSQAISRYFRPQSPWYMPDPDPQPVALVRPVEADFTPIWYPRATWPTMQDYNEAVQSPELCFRDQALRAGEVECNNLGLPRAVSGAFATVYKVSKNGRHWAVRCFNQPVKDQSDRYVKVAERIASARLISSFTQFKFIEEGIRVGRDWLPIVVMEWVEAPPLNIWVEQNLQNKQKLTDLRSRLALMSNQLQMARIAHGDLQHGNILVRNDRPVLVDYDSMYVDALAGRGSPEIGHRNYQHPDRQKHHFAPYLDNFSVWVIDTAMAALEVEPTLWDKFSNTGEQMLFCQHDFLNPDSSPLIKHLLSHANEEVRGQTTRLLRWLALSPEQVPALGSPPFTSGSGLPDWMT